MPLSRKLAICILQEKIPLDEVLNLLIKYNLLGLIPFIKTSLSQMSLDIHKHNTIMIETPFELSQDSVKKIKEIIGKQDVPHAIFINKNILAGFKAKYNGLLYDGSAERIIRQLTN